MKSSELITGADLAGITDQVDTLTTSFVDHQGQSIATSHGNVTVLDEAVYDNNSAPYDDSPGSPTGNKVGMVTLVIRAAGYLYKIPASTNPLGIPFLPQMDPLVPAQAYSYASGGQSQPDISVAGEFDATQPTIITWEVYVGTAWEAINASFTYSGGTKSTATSGIWGFRPTQAVFTFTGGDGTETVTSGNMTYTTPAHPSPTTQDAVLTLEFFSNGATGRRDLGKIRLKVDNRAIGGGIKYSAVCPVYIEDVTDCI